ncbi:MAG TPA: ABC transporter substrate-binding protein [Gaiellales bacterium]|nr:ABC transporter substrate-binding protein [Gaiellales bacterium]
MSSKGGRITRRGLVRSAAAAALASTSLAWLAEHGPASGAAPKALRILQSEPVFGFNPVLESTNWPETNRLVYNGLTDYNPAGQLVPGIAKSWKVSDRADLFTFTLQPGVKFTDGKELTSEDVRFTYELLVDQNVASSLGAFLSNLKTVETPDKYTAVLRFDGPNVLMLPFISPMGIIPAHLWAGSDPRTNKYLRQPVGSGPYILTEWQHGDHISFTRNPNYFRAPKPAIDQVFFKVAPDASTGLLSFLNHGLDAVLSQGIPGGPPYDQMRRIVEAKPAGMVSSEYEQNWGQYLFVNTTKPPFNNVKVRQALAHAIDKAFIVKTLLFGFGRPQESLVLDTPATKWAHEPHIAPYDYSVAKANALLDEAGLPRKGGTRFPVTILATEGFRVKLSEALKEMLGAVGIAADIKAYTYGEYIGRIRRQDTAGCLWTLFISKQMDPAAICEYVNAKNAQPGGTNFSAWSNAQVSEWIQQARATTDRAKRRPVYSQIQTLVHQEVPMMPLYSANGVDLWYSYVAGVHPVDSLVGTMQSVEDARITSA